MSDILKSAERFKRNLLKGNDKAIRRLIGAYDETWKQLQNNLDAVTRLINEAQAAGKHAVAREVGSKVALAPDEYTIDWLRRQARYNELLRQIETEVHGFSKQAIAETINEQDWGVKYGQASATELLKESLGPVPKEFRGKVAVTWNRAPSEALQNLVGFLADGSPLDYKFAGLPKAVADGVRDTLSTGFEAGWNPKKIAREVRRTYDGGLENGLTTCRTEVMRAYRTASHETYQANSDVCDGWVWLSAMSDRTCCACLAQNGSLHPLTESLNDHPSGRCVAACHTRSYAEILGDDRLKNIKDTSIQPFDAEDKFKALSETEQRKVLGVKRYELFKDGKISLSDCATKVKSEVWGDHYAPTSLKELVSSGKITVEDALAAAARK